MISCTRNLLISSALVLSAFSHTVVGMEGEKQEKAPVNLSAWGVASSLVTSFFEPFSQDVQTLKEKGFVQCASDILTADDKSNADMTLSLETVISVEQVLEQSILTGIAVSRDILEEIIRKGTPVAKAALYPAIALSCDLAGFHPAFGLAATFAALASNNPGRKALAYTAGGLALIYVLQNFPGVEGTLTPTIGGTFQMNHNAVSNSPVDVAGLKNGNFVGVWTDGNSPTNVIARVFFPNGTAVTSEITVTSTPASSQVAVLPSVAGLTGGNFIVTWQGEPLSILSRIYNQGGTAVTGAFTTNQITTHNSLGASVVTGLKNGNAFLAWPSGDNSGNSYISGRIFSSTGGAVTNEFDINQAPFNAAGNPAVVGLADGNVLTAWYNFNNPSGFLGHIIFPNGTSTGNPFPINQTALSSNTNIEGAGLTDGSAFVTYQNKAGFVGLIIKNGAPSGNEFSIGTGHNGDPVPVAGLIDGNALAVWRSTVSPLADQGNLFDSTGAALTNQFGVGCSQSFSVSVAGLSGGGANVASSNATAVYGSRVSFPLPPTPTPTPTPTVAPTPTPKVAPTPTPTSAASGLTSSFATSAMALAASYLSWYYGGYDA